MFQRVNSCQCLVAFNLMMIRMDTKHDELFSSLFSVPLFCSLTSLTTDFFVIRRPQWKPETFSRHWLYRCE